MFRDGHAPSARAGACPSPALCRGRPAAVTPRHPAPLALRVCAGDCGGAVSPYPAHGRAAISRRMRRMVPRWGRVLGWRRGYSVRFADSALRRRGSAPPTPRCARGAGRAALRAVRGGARAWTARPVCSGWPSRRFAAPARALACPKVPLAGHRLRLFWTVHGTLGGPPLFERPPAFWPGLEGGEAPLSGEAPSGLPSLRSAPPLPLAARAPAPLKSRGPLASLGRAGLRPPPA